jgi:predicted dienelactone hydrolase
MRRLEIAGTIGLLLFSSYLFLRGFEATFALVLGVSAVLIVCHLGLEGYRWQMAPAYLAALGLIGYECVHRLSSLQGSYLVGSVAILLVLASVALCAILPVFRLPAPTGPYKVGTQIRHLVDEGRFDPFSDRPDRPRELMIQIWYPADKASRGSFAPYRERSITTFRSAHFALVRTHSILGARLAKAESRYPLLLYTPSWSGTRTECTLQVEELASHGYVVVGIDHPYSSGIIAFPDGRIVRRKFVGDEDYSSEAAVEAFAKAADQQVRIRAQDARFVLDVLERLNGNDPERLLTGSLDLTRVGIFGFSLGGGTAAQACWLDRRFKAGLDMGGMVAAESAEQGSFAPFLFMFEGMYESVPFTPEAEIFDLPASKWNEIEFTRKQFKLMKASLSKFGGYWMVIDGIKHFEFCDSPFHSPMRRGVASPAATARIISRYVLAFFDKHLKEIDQPLLDGPSSQIPGVRFQVWPAQTSCDAPAGRP